MAKDTPQYIPPSPQDSLAQPYQRLAAERGSCGVKLAGPFPATEAQEHSMSADTDVIYPPDAGDPQPLESHKNTSKSPLLIPATDPPESELDSILLFYGERFRSLGRLGSTRKPDAGGSSYGHVTIAGTVDQAASGLRHPVTARSECRESAEPLRQDPKHDWASSVGSRSPDCPAWTSCVELTPFRPIPRDLPPSRLPEPVQQLQDLSLTQTGTQSRPVSPLSSGGVFVTVPNSPPTSEDIVSTVTTLVGEGCPMSNNAGPSSYSPMTSLLPWHVGDLRHVQPRSIPGSFPSTVDDDTRHGASSSQHGLHLPLTSVKDAAQTLHQTCSTNHAVDTIPSDVSLGGQLHKPSGGQTRPRHGRRLLYSDDSWRRGK
jgi:hypothetical protein